MTKAEIADAIYRKMGITKREAAELVNSFLELVREQLAEGESVKLSGFGNFDILQKRSRRGRNPKTGEEIQITARKVLTFTPSRILRQKVNHDTDGP